MSAPIVESTSGGKPVRHVKLSNEGQDKHSDPKFRPAKRWAKRKSEVKKDPEVPRFAKGLEEAQMVLLTQAARRLMTPGFGVLAADESARQINSFLRQLNLPINEHNRRKYLEVLFDGKLELDRYVSGVILREESIDQLAYMGRRITQMVKGENIMLGIRMDKGLVRLPGTINEFATVGLDKLEASLMRVKEKGAEFALWRCVYSISQFTPSRLAIVNNSIELAKFAVTCQYLDLLPILSVEVLQSGDHSLEVAQGVLRVILSNLVKAMADYRVYMSGAIIRLTAATAGPCFRGNLDLRKAAYGTVKAINQSIPPAIGGIMLAREFNLSRSLTILRELQVCRVRKPHLLTYCFSQVIHNDVLAVWAGDNNNLDKARHLLLRKLKCCSLASFGQSDSSDKSHFIQVTCI